MKTDIDYAQAAKDTRAWAIELPILEAWLAPLRASVARLAADAGLKSHILNQSTEKT